MKTDKDQPWTWVKYRAGLCESCRGSCCTMPVEIKADDLVRLQLATEDEILQSKRKLFKRLRKEGWVQSYREGTDLFMLASKPNGECVFLDSQTRLCRVYTLRPEVCRQFPTVGPRPQYCPYQSKN